MVSDPAPPSTDAAVSCADVANVNVSTASPPLNVDALVDALGPLADSGVIWLMTPKPGREGHVEPEDIADAAPTSGLQATSHINAAPEWQGTRLVAPKSRR